jgi:hypothetical protein
LEEVEDTREEVEGFEVCLFRLLGSDVGLGAFPPYP